MKKSIRVKQRDASDCGLHTWLQLLHIMVQIPVSRIRQYAATDKKHQSAWSNRNS
jgi:hypothetical protein